MTVATETTRKMVPSLAPSLEDIAVEKPTKQEPFKPDQLTVAKFEELVSFGDFLRYMNTAMDEGVAYRHLNILSHDLNNAFCSIDGFLQIQGDDISSKHGDTVVPLIRGKIENFTSLAKELNNVGSNDYGAFKKKTTPAKLFLYYSTVRDIGNLIEGHLTADSYIMPGNKNTPKDNTFKSSWKNAATNMIQTVNPQAIPLQRLLDEDKLFSNYNTAGIQNPISFSVELPEDAANLYTHANLPRILDVLINNTKDHAYTDGLPNDEKKVTINVEIVSHDHQEQPYLRITYRDNGQGISQEVIDKGVFSGSSTRDEKDKSSIRGGIGLRGLAQYIGELRKEHSGIESMGYNPATNEFTLGIPISNLDAISPKQPQPATETPVFKMAEAGADQRILSRPQPYNPGLGKMAALSTNNG